MRGETRSTKTSEILNLNRQKNSAVSAVMSPISLSTQRKQRRQQRVKLEKSFPKHAMPLPSLPNALSYSPCTFPSRPCPALDASALFSLQVVRTWRQGQGQRSHQGENISDTATNAGRHVRQ